MNYPRDPIDDLTSDDVLSESEGVTVALELALDGDKIDEKEKDENDDDDAESEKEDILEDDEELFGFGGDSTEEEF